MNQQLGTSGVTAEGPRAPDQSSGSKLYSDFLLNLWERNCSYICEEMTQAEISSLASAWIRYWQAPEGSHEREINSSSFELMDFAYDDPETLWLIILEIHSKEESAAISAVFAAGPLEDLLALHGEDFIDRIEAEARRFPLFAKLLGGVWRNQMSEAVWKRVQSVWDRRGWDGIPE